MPLKEKFLTPNEVSQVLQVALSSVYSWIFHRKITSLKIGKHRMIPESEIKRLIEAGFRPARQK